MSEKKPIKAATKRTAPAKKSAAKKKTASVKKAVANTSTKTVEQTPSIDTSIQSVIGEMNSQRKSRDKQISALIEEVRDGFSTVSNNSNKLGEEHQKEMTSLYQSLQGAFGQVNDHNIEKEELNLDVFKSLSDSMMNNHKQSLKEITQQGELQDKKIEHMNAMLKQRTGSNRLIAVPGAIIAVVGVFYMFYVVSVMETAMSDMSANMHLIQKDVGNMSGSMGNMRNDTASINTNMHQLNGNMGQVSKDLNVMTHNVAPAMASMNKILPW
jgi:hypothetical protein